MEQYINIFLHYVHIYTAIKYECSLYTADIRMF